MIVVASHVTAAAAGRVGVEPLADMSSRLFG